MGKRQLGELQPIEFVITLILAELACVPMQEISIPLLYGLIPISVIFAIHFFISAFSSKSIKFRKFLNGSPIVVIDKNGLNYKSIKKLNMSVNDILDSLRDRDCFSIEQVSIAIVETTGKLSVLKNPNVLPPKTLPITIILEGIFLNNNALLVNTTKCEILAFLTNENLKLEDVLLLTIEEAKIFIQPKHQKFFSFQIGQSYEI
ncbi:MAG: DUF421 domain-containing protein [Christensenellaceae bacterium]|jgi:uncharacterized membrane protein YcaP (DUF421 family)|nr:DUF421 domain-containing protein [Christensenellaceae bacterium]